MKVVNVHETANVGVIDTGGGVTLEVPFDRDNTCYEVKIEHNGAYAFFYLFGGGALPLEQWALKRLAGEECWSSFEEFKDGQVYPEGMTEETARKLYNYRRDLTERLYKLLGERSYEEFMREHNH